MASLVSSDTQGQLHRCPEELLYGSQVRGPTVLRQAVQKHPPVLLLQYAIIQQAQQPTIMQRSDQPSKALLQRDHRRGHLVLEESIPTRFIYGPHPGRDNRISGDREWQTIDNYA